MKEIHTAIPNVDALLALQPEELAGKLLFLMKERFKNKPDQLQPSDFISEVMTEPTEPEGGGGYPRDKRVEVAFALTEAMSWLQAQGLLVPFPPDQNGPGKLLSRRANAFQSITDFQHFALAGKLNRELLHPAIRGGSVCLNSFGRLVKWISASIMPPPSSVPAR